MDGSRPLCCGRTFLASGLVDEARAEARRMIAVLKPYIESGVPVVGLEPSCLLGLRDEFLSMLPGGESAELALPIAPSSSYNLNWPEPSTVM
jgi:Fe-S oxidoreductase